MNEIILAGCTPTPLANYLKALGVLRLLSARYPKTKAAWSNETLVLHTPLDRPGLEQFFLHDYQPTPIMAPWNGGSGFYFQERKSKEKDPETGKKKKLGIRNQPTAATKTVDSVIASTGTRLNDYRVALTLSRILVKQLGLEEAPDNGPPKDGLIRSLRGNLPENCLDWLDAALVVTTEQTQFPPLLGTGGNDGNLDFTSNFMQRLIDVIGTEDGSLPSQSSDWLHTSLFGMPAPGLVKSNIGQFSPGQAGGPNASNGFDGHSATNPWDFVLMIEGALPFAAAAVRRNADDTFGVLSYPFTVRAVGAGFGSLGGSDAAAARGELWMPLWDQPATYAEIRALLAEGRVALGKKPARDALDFIRAVHHLGGYRGIRSFQRYGLLMRSGKAYLATPLERVEVTDEPSGNILDELDQHDWLAQFRRFAQGDNVANRFLSLRRRLETAFFDLSGQHPSANDVQSVLMLLGEIQSALASSKKAIESVPPVPRLSERWVQLADDRMPAFRLVCALAGLKGTADIPLPIRAQLFPMHPRFNCWMDDARKAKGASNDPACRVRLHTGLQGNLPDALHALLARRLWLADQFDMRNLPLQCQTGASLDDLAAFLRSDAMDRRIAALLPGLSLCAIPQDTQHSAGDGIVPAAFALLKLCLTPESTLHALDVLNESERLPVPPGFLTQLAAGNIDNRAVRTAWQRLRASGLNPVFNRNALPSLDGIDPRRAAAALLIPLRFGATGALVRSVLKTSETA